MSSWQFESVQEGPRNLPLKFGKIHASNSWDIADIDTVHYLSGRVGGWVGGWGVWIENKTNSASIELKLKLNWVEAELGNIDILHLWC